MLSPIVQTPRYRLVADEIAARIRAGDFARGTKMPADKDLVARLGVSRTTVREAMIALELMGYVVTRFGAGAFVADPLPEGAEHRSDLPGFFELVEARVTLEPEIAATAAMLVGATEIAALERCIRGMCDADLPLQATEAHDREFHLILARATGNSIFVWLIEEFWRVRQQFPEWTRLDNRRSDADIARFYSQEHDAILDALRAGDAAAARAAMQVHCRNSGQPLLERWRQEDHEPGDPIKGVVQRIFRQAHPAS